MDKVLIIGSKGFIGQHAYQHFKQQPNYLVWACDVVTEYNDPNYFQIDASNSDYSEVFEAELFDFCINCSGAASVPDSLKHPLRDFSLNTYNVIKILDVIRRYTPLCHFINLSSAAVYGNPTSLPISEISIIRPVSPYGQHKLIAEMLCQQYHDYFGLSVCSLRIFSAYGPGLQKQLLWDTFQKSGQASSILLFGNGNESRDFIFINDIIHAIKLVMKKGEFDGRAYNLGSGTETTVAEAVGMLLKALNYNGTVSFSGTRRTGDPVAWRADISQLSLLGFSPIVSIQEGIKLYVKWLRETGLL